MSPRLSAWRRSASRPITVVIGTRAQLIKMAPVLRQLEDRQSRIRLVLTGQHSVTMDALLSDFRITTTPDFVYEGPEIAGLLRMASWAPLAIVRLFRRRRELLRDANGATSLVMVHGDTFSTLIGALAARLAGCPVAHVESGLRSFNPFNPFPEELTRVLVFRLADIAFCPGKWAAGNMDGYRAEVVDTGQNTLLDALRLALDEAADDEQRETRQGNYCVVSVHRFENIFFRRRLEWIVKAIETAARQVDVRFVLHPATERRLRSTGLLERLEADPRIQFLERTSYVPFIRMLRGARFVMTDGGSNQEELYYMQKPTLLLRHATERTEGLEGWAVLCRFRESVLKAFLAEISARRGPSDVLNADVHPSRGVVERLHPEAERAAA